MIKVSKLRILLDDIKLNVAGIADTLMVVHEGHAVNKMKDKRGVVLMAIYPSADRQGILNEGTDNNSTWLFILEKDVEGQNDQKEELQFSKLQEIILQVRDFLEESAATTHCYLQRIDVRSMKINPEYREFGGFNGWSLALVF